MRGLPAESAEVVIVGAGPAGLTAARYLRASGVFRVPWDLFRQVDPEAGGVALGLSPP